jgi:predicted nuclease of predicted toxin-antitoxin system
VVSKAVAVRDVGLRDADAAKIFVAARKAGAVVLTKDEDFVTLVSRLGSPPAVVWLTCGNVPNRQLKKILHAALPDALALIQRGEPVVEISRGEPPARRRRPRSTRRRGSARPE